jgi:glycosyltransferase involved in cell wall biosynthesis
VQKEKQKIPGGTSAEYPFLSVLIPVYNDNRGLEILLESLRNQSYPKDRFEVIVVDNGSAENVQKVTDQHENIILLYEKDIQSSYAARNKGIRQAQGEILVFVDSDCRASQNWLAEGVKKLMESGSDMVGGQVVFDIATRSSAAEYYDATHNIQIKEKINRGTCATCNAFIGKNVFDAIGLFPQHIKSGGDVYFSKKATENGFTLVYAPKAIVYHPARTFWPLIKKTFRVGAGKAAIRSMSLNTMGKGGIKTVQSGKLFDLFNPVALKRKINQFAYHIHFWKFIQIFFVSYVVLFAGFLGVLYGKFFTRTAYKSDK